MKLRRILALLFSNYVAGWTRIELCVVYVLSNAISWLGMPAQICTLRRTSVDVLFCASSLDQLFTPVN